MDTHIHGWSSMIYVVSPDGVLFGKRHGLVVDLLSHFALAGVMALLGVTVWRVVLQNFLSVRSHLGADTRTNVLSDFLPVFAEQSDRCQNKSLH